MKNQVAASLGLKYEREIDPLARASAHQAKKAAWSELLGWIGKAQDVIREIKFEEESLMERNVAHGRFSAEERTGGTSGAVKLACVELAIRVSKQRLAHLREHLANLEKRHQSARQHYTASRDEADCVETEAKRIEFVNAWIDEQVSRYRQKKRRVA